MVVTLIIIFILLLLTLTLLLLLYGTTTLVGFGGTTHLFGIQNQFGSGLWCPVTMDQSYAIRRPGFQINRLRLGRAGAQFDLMDRIGIVPLQIVQLPLQ
jgi:hypothetical protein